MDTELFNPTRRYKHFRPREALRGSKGVAAPTNHATISIFNDSTGPRILVLRDILVTGTANDLVATSYQPGQIGTSQGLVAPYLPSSGTLGGKIAGIDTATAYAADYTIALSSLGAYEWYHDFPYAVVEPGFSLVFQAITVAHATTVSAVWESISIDELDFFW
jgi:hypothetical protein